MHWINQATQKMDSWEGPGQNLNVMMMESW